MHQEESEKKARVILSDLRAEKWSKHVTAIAMRHLESSLSQLKGEKAGVPAIPLFGKTDWSVVTDYYASLPEKGVILPEWQLEYELARESKFGIQGGRATWEVLRPEVEMYVTNPQPCRADMIPETVEKYYDLKCTKDTFDTVLKKQIKEDKIGEKAAGWNNFNEKKTDKHAQQQAVEFAKKRYFFEGFGYVFSYDKKNKHRIFIPGPFSLNIAQAQYHDPILRAIQEDLLLKGKNSKFVFFGDKIGFQPLWHIMGERSKQYDPSHIVYVVRDFFHMDTTQGISQKVKHFVPKVCAAFGVPQNCTEGNYIKEVMIYSNRMPIATPDGVIVNEDKGEASGVTVTNMGEGFCNEDFDYTLTQMIIARCKQEDIHVFLIDTYGNGDDGHSRWYLEDVSKFPAFNQIIEECADICCKMYGYLKNDKWKINLGTYGVYCQYEVYSDTDGFHADYPVSLALNAIMHPMHEIKKELWDSDFVDWRNVEILSHLYGRRDFKIAVDYVDNGMKRGLFGKTADDFKRIFFKYKKYRALRSSESDYNVDSFRWVERPDMNPVIRYIAEKRNISVPDTSAPTFWAGI